MIKISSHHRFTCYLCDKEFNGRKLESFIGSGKLTRYICLACTRANYCWDNNPKSSVVRRAKELGLET